MRVYFCVPPAMFGEQGWGCVNSVHMGKVRRRSHGDAVETEGRVFDVDTILVGVEEG